MKKAYLILGDGSVFEGERFGADSDALGELVFTTGMGGYIETLTDPSYYGQIAVQTFPLIGNYGFIPSDIESERCVMKAYVVNGYCGEPSNFRCEGTVDGFLKSQGIPGLSGVDTRRITCILREHGVMNAMIRDSLPTESELDEMFAYRVENSVSATSCAAKKELLPQSPNGLHIALLDYGAKNAIARSLVSRGCRVTVFPYDTKADTLLSSDIDGIMLSNGPGDPNDNIGCIAEIEKLVGRKPIFGICLGHQMLALALGNGVGKMKYGHRGVNQPVRDIVTGRVYITSQNHGYAVEPSGGPGCGKMRFVNADDGSCEGMDYEGLNAFSVQFHPEACAGPADAAFLFDRFISLAEGAKSNASR